MFLVNYKLILVACFLFIGILCLKNDILTTFSTIRNRSLNLKHDSAKKLDRVINDAKTKKELNDFSMILPGSITKALSNSYSDASKSFFMPKIDKEIDDFEFWISERDNFYVITVMKVGFLGGGIKYIIRKKDGKILKRNKTR